MVSRGHRESRTPISRFRYFLLILAAWQFVSATAVLSEPAMWVIRGHDSTIYLVGTVHLLRQDMQWNSTKLDKALAESSSLWLEIADPDDQSTAIPLLQKLGVDMKKPLSGKLPPNEREKLNKAIAEYSLPREQVETMQPWVAAVMFTVLPLQKAGYDPNSALDRVLKTKAEQKGATVLGLETLDQQLRFLAELPERDQVAFLDDTLNEVEKGIALFEKLAKAWSDGDSKTLVDLLVNPLRQKSPQLYEKLLVRRNVRWAEQIDSILRRPGVQLIAVGAGHLVGPDSVQIELAKRGIKADPY